jgi:hypothetical protein
MRSYAAEYLAKEGLRTLAEKGKPVSQENYQSAYEHLLKYVSPHVATLFLHPQLRSQSEQGEEKEEEGRPVVGLLQASTSSSAGSGNGSTSASASADVGALSPAIDLMSPNQAKLDTLIEDGTEISLAPYFVSF